MSTQPVTPAPAPAPPAPVPAQPPAPTGQAGEHGFPAGTAVADMTAEQQAAYWRHHAQKHEGRAKGWATVTGGRTAEQVQAELAELATLRQGQQTDAERAVAEARQQAQSETRAQYAPMLAAAEFRAALAHVPADRRDAIIEGLNLAAYVGDDGQVATDRVRAYAETVAPVATTTPPPAGYDFGAGQRQEQSAPRGAAGRAEAEKRFGKTTTAGTPAG